MIRDLDETIQALLKGRARPGSELASASISFELPDAAWRGGLLPGLTVNCYLYDIRENLGMRTSELLYARSGARAKRIRPPVRVDCGYCITAWNTATGDQVFAEHRLISQVLQILIRAETIPPEFLRGDLKTQVPPYPTVVASQEGVKNLPEFWNALDQRLKPSLNYVVTLAMMMEDVPAEADMGYPVTTVNVEADHKESAS